tara:strand:+ start:148 stop:543 length:396 start_codon:yes stop_codon:yes gene_type:complete
MLKFTKTIEYGLIAMRHINEQNNKLCSCKKIAKTYHIPSEILAKTMQKLCKQGYLKAIKGPKGGYLLNKNLNTIHLIDFIEDIEGPIGIVDCSVDTTCDLLEFCNIKSPINKINKNIRNLLNNVSLYEITN